MKLQFSHFKIMVKILYQFETINCSVILNSVKFWLVDWTNRDIIDAVFRVINGFIENVKYDPQSKDFHKGVFMNFWKA